MNSIDSIVKARGGDVIAKWHDYPATSISEAAENFGLFSDPDNYHQIEQLEALLVLSNALHKDMAYRSELVPRRDAQELAIDFVLNSCPPDADFYTNGNFGHRRTDPNVGPSWSPVTTATFDTGIIMLSDNAHACVWFMDED